MFKQLKNYGLVLENEPMELHTSMRVGGKVRAYILCENIDNLIKIIKFLKDKNQKYMIIGRGSNIIFPDYDMDLVVIAINNVLNNLEINNNIITVGAGYSLQKLAKQVSKLGLSGLEFAGGIPGSIGGSVYMNAGAHLSMISNVISKVYCLDENGNKLELTKDKCQFSYRNSIFQKKNLIIYQVELKLEQKERSEVYKKMAGNLSYREELQPLDLPSCGSVFKNPENNHAGKLIDEAGLKGTKIGGALVSTKHANFIVNSGNASAENIKELIICIKETIKEQFGITLEEEIKILEGIDERK